MTNETPRSGMLAQIIVAVAIALLVGGTAPWWWEIVKPKPSSPPQVVYQPKPGGSAQVVTQPLIGGAEPRLVDQEVGGPIAVRCDANPVVISPGGTSELLIRATSSQNAPISGANVKVEVGGGSFSSGGTIAVGTTAVDGSFRALWRAPGGVSYGFSVEVVKPGFEKGTTDCTVNIQ